MKQHDIDWEQKGTHHDHLSVLDYKKQERIKEIAELEKGITVIERKKLDIEAIEKIEVQKVPFTSKVIQYAIK